MSVCAYLPDGRVAFTFDRPADRRQRAGCRRPGLAGRRRPTAAIASATTAICCCSTTAGADRPRPRLPRSPAGCPRSPRLVSTSLGLEAVMGRDQDHIDRIFLPGQADFHYQHLARTTGRIRVDDQTWEIDGRGGRDHSWGPRNWHAKIYLRWLICALDDAERLHAHARGRPDQGDARRTRVGRRHLPPRRRLRTCATSYSDAPHHGLRSVEVDIKAGELRWSAPRHAASVASLASSAAGRGRARGHAAHREVADRLAPRLTVAAGAGHCEYHDLMDAGRPIGLDD